MDRLKYRWYRIKQAVPQKIAWMLPRQVAYWAAIRVFAHATTGKYGNQVVPELRVTEALGRWPVQS